MMLRRPLRYTLWGSTSKIRRAAPAFDCPGVDLYMFATPNSRSKGVFFRRRCTPAVNPPRTHDHRAVLCEQAQNARAPISSALTLLASLQCRRFGSDKG